MTPLFMLYPNLYDSPAVIGIDSRLLLLHNGHALTEASSPRTDTHQKQESHIKKCTLRPGTAIEKIRPLIKMD
jgi:hypothetical protein